MGRPSALGGFTASRCNARCAAARLDRCARDRARDEALGRWQDTHRGDEPLVVRDGPEDRAQPLVLRSNVGDEGAISDWIVNNFYTLDTESEKGILPAMVPLDNYLTDLNS